MDEPTVEAASLTDRCPKCRSAVGKTARECPSCGLIFSKFRARPTISQSSESKPETIEIAEKAQTCKHCGEELRAMVLRCRACGGDQVPARLKNLARMSARMRAYHAAKLSEEERALLARYVAVLEDSDGGRARPRSGGEIAVSLAMAAAALGSVLGGALLVVLFPRAESAPQEAVAASLSIAVAVIPYCFARALAGLRRAKD